MHKRISAYLFLWTHTFSLKEQTFFAQRLAFLIRANVSLVESIEILTGHMRSPVHRALMQTILNDISNGYMLSKSLARFPSVCSEFGVQIIRVGESSGTLSQNLEYLADELTKRHALRRKVVSACIYPALITAATLGVTLFLTVYLFPKIMPVFVSLNVDLPLSTRAMILISAFVVHWGVYLLLFVVLVGIAFSYMLHRSVLLRRFLDRVYLHAPLFGKMFRFYYIANACRTLGLLLASGMQLSEALQVTADTTKNLIYKEEFMCLAVSINRGETMSKYIAQRPWLFPDVLGNMIAVGERSGTLSKTLLYLSDMYDAEVEDFTKNISVLIEPVLMLLMGLMVGFIAISIITPIYGITQNLHA